MASREDDGTASAATLMFVRRLAELVLGANHRTQGGYAGQAFTEYTCQLCGLEKMHHTTAAPLLCEMCGDDLLQIISPLGVPDAKDPRPLNAKNFLEFAQRAIAAYFDSGRIVDALLWRSIVGHYDAETARLRAAMTGALHTGDACGCYACTLLRRTLAQ